MTASRLRNTMPNLQKLASRFDSPIADRELLQRFHRAHHEAAFADIVRRPGTMVLRGGRLAGLEAWDGEGPLGARARTPSGAAHQARRAAWDRAYVPLASRWRRRTHLRGIPDYC